MKKISFKVLAVLLSVAMLSGILPVVAEQTVDTAQLESLSVQRLKSFIDEGTHQQLLERTDAVYMKYAEVLRTDRGASISLDFLAFIYQQKSEPGKEEYIKALLNVIKTCDDEYAAEITQQQQLDDVKGLKDYLHDVVDLELDLLGLGGIDEAIGEDVSLALSVINQTLKEEDDWAEGVAALQSMLQNYEKHNAFLQLVEKKATGALKEAAAELRTMMSEIMQTRLRAFGEMTFDSAKDYANLFCKEIFAKEWRSWIEAKIKRDLSFFDYWPKLKLSVEVGKLLADVLVRAEDIITYILEIKAVHDVSVVLEQELAYISNMFNVTEMDVQNYVSYGNYLISCRIRGQYCMSVIYIKNSVVCGFLEKFGGHEEVAEKAELIYNRLTNKLANIKRKLDAIAGVESAAVIDALNYEKDVIADPSLSDFWEPNGWKHRIAIPKLVGDTEAIRDFNRKIYDNYSTIYDTVLNNREGNRIYECEYNYKVYNGLVAIAIVDSRLVQAGGGNSNYRVYYFDLNENRELTRDEYLSSVGISYAEVVSRITSSDEYKQEMQYMDYPVTDMTDCLLDENGTHAFFNDFATMHGWREIKTDSVLSGKTVAYRRIFGGVEADSIQYYNCARSGNFAVVERNGKYGIIGYDGEMILPISFEYIGQGSGYGYEYLIVEGIESHSDWWGGHIDQNGQLKEGYPSGGDVDPTAYWYNDQLVVCLMGSGILGGLEELSSVEIAQRPWEKNSVLPIQEMSGIDQNAWGSMPKVDNTNYALVNTTTGKLVSDFIYAGFDAGNGFSEGVLAVKKGDNWGFVDAEGNEITDFLYDPYEQDDSYENHMEYRYSIYTAVNGYIAVLEDGKWGLIDLQGNTVVDTVYEGISQVNPDGMFWICEGGTWSLYQLEN